MFFYRLRDLNSIINVPRLNLGERVGHTGYIDFISPKDMTAPIMTGRDVYGRNFIAICVDIYGKDDKFLGSSVGTFFERYSDSSQSIAYGTNVWSVEDGLDRYTNILYFDSRVRDNHEYVIERIYNLAKGVKVYNYDSDMGIDPNSIAMGNGPLRLVLSNDISNLLSRLSI